MSGPTYCASCQGRLPHHREGCASTSHREFQRLAAHPGEAAAEAMESRQLVFALIGRVECAERALLELAQAAGADAAVSQPGQMTADDVQRLRCAVLRTLDQAGRDRAQRQGDGPRGHHSRLGENDERW